MIIRKLSGKPKLLEFTRNLPGNSTAKFEFLVNSKEFLRIPQDSLRNSGGVQCTAGSIQSLIYFRGTGNRLDEIGMKIEYFKY